MCQISLKFLRHLAILAIAIFPSSEAQLWSFEAADSVAEKGECFVGGAYTANAMDCLNDGEAIPDPFAGTLLAAPVPDGMLAVTPGAGILLCDATLNGRFNLQQLYPRGTASGAAAPTTTVLATTADTRNRQCSGKEKKVKQI
jgi:hypothetical protein